MRLLIASLLVGLFTVILMITAQASDTYVDGPARIYGTASAFNINSVNGSLVTTSGLSDPYYAFWQSDVVEFSFNVTDHNKTASWAYLYHGDGTGQFISVNSNYTKSYAYNADYNPVIIVGYTDNTSEEIHGPLLIETFLSTQVVSTRPTSFTPPTTLNTTVNTYLGDEGHTVQGTTNFICLCGRTEDINGEKGCGKRYVSGSSDCKDTAGTAQCFDKCKGSGL